MTVALIGKIWLCLYEITLPLYRSCNTNGIKEN